MNQLLCAIALFYMPGGSAPGPGWHHEGFLVVCNQQDANAELIDLKTGKSVRKVATGTGPHEASASADGKTVVVTNYGAQVPGNSLTLIAIPSGNVVKTIDLGMYTRPHGAAWLDKDHVIVTIEMTQNVVIVDVAKGVVDKAISTGFPASHMLAVPADKARVFTANILAGNVSAIDLAKGEKVGEAAAGAKSEGIAVSPDGTRIVTGNLTGSISIIDAKAMKPLKTLETGGSPYRAAFSPDGSLVYVPNPMAGELIVVDVAKLEIKARISTTRDPGNPSAMPAGPTGIAIHPSGKFAYVSLAAATAVGIIDLDKREVVARISVGKSPDGVAFARG